MLAARMFEQVHCAIGALLVGLRDAFGVVSVVGVDLHACVQSAID